MQILPALDYVPRTNRGGRVDWSAAAHTGMPLSQLWTFFLPRLFGDETLRFVLKARRPQEFAFVDLVTLKVKQGKLPLAVVLSMMKWAVERAREKESKIPFPYFQEGLRLRAKELGVDLPAFMP